MAGPFRSQCLSASHRMDCPERPAAWRRLSYPYRCSELQPCFGQRLSLHHSFEASPLTDRKKPEAETLSVGQENQILSPLSRMWSASAGRRCPPPLGPSPWLEGRAKPGTRKNNDSSHLKNKHRLSSPHAAADVHSVFKKGKKIASPPSSRQSIASHALPNTLCSGPRREHRRPPGNPLKDRTGLPSWSMRDAAGDAELG